VTNFRIDRLIQDFGRHCRGEERHNLDNVAAGLVELIGQEPLDSRGDTHKKVCTALERVIIAASQHHWEREENVSDATLAYTDHFSPSIHLLRALKNQSEQLLVRLVERHCAEPKYLDFGDYQAYLNVLKSKELPTHSGEMIISYLVVNAQRVGFAPNFPIAQLIAASARYEYRECLAKHEDAILTLTPKSLTAFRACEIFWGCKLWDYGLKRLGVAVIEGSDIVPRNVELLWMKQHLGLTPSEKWQARCWESHSDTPLEAIVRYYLEYDDIEFPKDVIMHSKHLVKALKLYDDAPSIYMSDRYGELVDHLIVNNDDARNPIFETLPRQALERSELYAERQLLTDLGL
jgi:hypothetical protein